MTLADGQPRIGFIGLGAMGGPMAAHLAETHDVIAFDLRAGDATAGYTVAESVEQIATEVEIVALSLPSANASESVVDQLIATPGRRIRTIVDLSTIGVAVSRRLAAAAEAEGIDYVDAPVSGGVVPAGNGTLSTIVAGSPDAVKRARVVLEGIADKIYVVGESAGQGQVMKLANNIVALTSIIVTSEAVAYGVGQGLDMAQMIEVMNGSTGRTHASEFKFPRSIIPGTYDYGARGEITSKDVHLYLVEAQLAGVSTAIAEVSDRIWQGFLAEHPNTDFTYVYEYVRGLASEQLSDR